MTHLLEKLRPKSWKVQSTLVPHFLNTPFYLQSYQIRVVGRDNLDRFVNVKFLIPSYISQDRKVIS